MESGSDQIIDDYLAAIATAMDRAGQIVPWPLHLAQIGPYYGDIEAADIYGRLRARVSAGASDRDIGSLFVTASSGKSLLMDLIPGLKDARIAAADRAWFVSKILTAIAAVETGDVFCCDGAHRLLTEAEAEAAAAACQRRGRWAAGYPGSAFTLSGAAQALVWSQHFYGWTDIGFVIHGPYPMPGGEQLIVRDFTDLRPVGLWPHSADVPVRRLIVTSVHDATDEYAVDVFNHLLHGRAQLDSCVALRAECDGTAVTDPAELDAIRAALVTQIRRQHEVLTAMSTTQLLAKFVESRYYALRLWREPGDWRPGQEVRDRIERRPLEPPPPTDGDWDFLSQLFDPRLDFPG